MICLLSVNGLFDFDLTFFFQALLFAIFSLIVNFAFLSPISNQLAERSVYLDYNQKIAAIKLSLGQEKLSTYIEILDDDIQESARQVKNFKQYTTSKLSSSLLFVQKTSNQFLKETKGKLIIACANNFSSSIRATNTLTKKFFFPKLSFF